jgi:disulfide bond formation protein DsbB
MTRAIRPPSPAAALAAIAAAMLAAAFAFEHVAGLRPCVLCWWQRYAWMAALVCALPAAATRGHVATALLLAAALATLGGAGIAGYHAGVEQGWWRGTDACGSTLGAAQTAEERLRQLLAAPVVRCDEIAWSFAGLSMAAWNGVVAAVAGGLALDALRRRLTRIAS